MSEIHNLVLNHVRLCRSLDSMSLFVNHNMIRRGPDVVWSACALSVFWLVLACCPQNGMGQTPGLWKRVGANGCCIGASNSIISPIGIDETVTTVNKCKQSCESISECQAFNMNAVLLASGKYAKGSCVLLPWSPAVIGSNSDVNCRCFVKKYFLGSFSPTHAPSISPSTSTASTPGPLVPTASPTMSPSVANTDPTVSPSTVPSISPTRSTRSPSLSPVISPTRPPTLSPATLTSTTTAPMTVQPTSAPTISPTRYPTETQTLSPTETLNFAPTTQPTKVRWQLLDADGGCCVSTDSTALSSIGEAPGADTVNKCKQACNENHLCGAFNMLSTQTGARRWAKGVCQMMGWEPDASGTDANPNCRCFRKMYRLTHTVTTHPTSPFTQHPSPTPTNIPTISTTHQTTSPLTQHSSTPPTRTPSIHPTTSPYTQHPSPTPTHTPTISTPTSVLTSAPTSQPTVTRWRSLNETGGCCESETGTTLTSLFIPPGADSVNKCKLACANEIACGGFNMLSDRNPTSNSWNKGTCALLSWYPHVTTIDANPNCRCYQKVNRPRLAPPYIPQIATTSTSPTTVSSSSNPPTSVGTPKPNILHIVADDLGNYDLGYKNDIVETPNLDMMAKQGVRLTSHYVMSTCSPTRAAMFTGRYSWRQGYYKTSGSFQHAHADLVMLPQVLKDHGYQTVAIGKWHLGFVYKQFTPTYKGFDSFFGYYGGAHHDHWFHGQRDEKCLNGFRTDLSDNNGDMVSGAPGFNGTYITHIITEQAVAKIEAHAASNRNNADSGSPVSPLYLYVGQEAPHDAVGRGVQAPLDTVSRYDSTIVDDTYKVFAASVTEMDWSIGNITNSFKTEGMWANTIVIFLSDNGASLRHAYNYPYRAGKRSMFEGGLRGECFVYSALLPSVLRGTAWNGLMHVSDWFHTITEGIAGATLTTDTGPLSYDGMNMWPAIISRGVSPRTEIVHQAARDDIRQLLANTALADATVALRVGDFKLIMGMPGDTRTFMMPQPPPEPIEFGHSWGSIDANTTDHCTSQRPPTHTPTVDCSNGCLFNIVTDPTESDNLVSDPLHAQRVESMQQRLVEAAEDALAPSEAEVFYGDGPAREQIIEQWNALCAVDGFMQPIDLTV
eukprot:m.37262 g.37262  ORF g.37262 m.37262 type:complete len:1122 (-) comp17613_c0_seq1:99-3464(-)